MNFMAKKIDEFSMVNELKGASAYFTDRKEPVAKVDRAPTKRRSVERNDRSVLPIDGTDRETGGDPSTGDEHTVLSMLQDGPPVETKRQTERYAFEAYTDQKKRSRDISYRIERETGRRISISQIIREALDAHLDQLEVLLNEAESNS